MLSIHADKMIIPLFFHFHFPFGSKTRPSSDSEAATMYKLKGKSSNMQTGQGFK